MKTFLHLVKIVLLVSLVVLAPLFIFFRRVVIFLKEKFFDLTFLSKIEFDAFSKDDDIMGADPCSSCLYKRHSTHGYKPVLFHPMKPFLLILIINYLFLIKGCISKKDFIIYFSD